MKMNYLKMTLGVLAAALAVSGCASVEHTDVLVIGGGASGISAAVQTARMGVPVMVVEETPWVGGMLTSAGVSCIDGNYRLQGGIFGEFADSLAQRYGGWDALKTGWVSNINFEPSVGQEVLTNIAASCGNLLSLRRETAMLDVTREEDLWKVKLKDKEGKKYIVTADVLIDATELGDVAKACGVEYSIGMEAASQTGESIAPEAANDIIQDLTYVAVLKDYGPDADMTIEKPEGYDPQMFANSCDNPLAVQPLETGQTLWPAEMMISYGRLPGGKYMINWPIYGNDYYVNSIDMTPRERKEAYAQAKNFTLCFLYFIQTELGMKNLGIADDEFPTEDGLPFFPYHRESRRIKGKAFLTLDAAAAPYDYKSPYYRTSIAVGDYPVDHHHYRHPSWKTLPDLKFYPVPSFSVPMGVMLPENVENLIVAEKSVSVSNLINGATRLQPVVMQLGQAAGALAATACNEGKPVSSVKIRKVQQALLKSGAYLMPFLDLPKDHRHFKVLQRIGVTGILRGEGRQEGWANQTWFRADDPLRAEDIYASDYSPIPLDFGQGELKIGDMLGLLKQLRGYLHVAGITDAQWWKSLGLEDYDPSRVMTRLEAAVVIDATFDPFWMFDVNYSGKLR